MTVLHQSNNNSLYAKPLFPRTRLPDGQVLQSTADHKIDKIRQNQRETHLWMPRSDNNKKTPPEPPGGVFTAIMK